MEEMLEHQLPLLLNLNIGNSYQVQPAQARVLSERPLGLRAAKCGCFPSSNLCSEGLHPCAATMLGHTNNWWSLGVPLPLNEG
jgi:hypothetical protein